MVQRKVGLLYRHVATSCGAPRIRFVCYDDWLKVETLQCERKKENSASSCHGDNLFLLPGATGDMSSLSSLNDVVVVTWLRSTSGYFVFSFVYFVSPPRQSRLAEGLTFSTCPSVRPLPSLWTRHLENEWTDFNPNCGSRGSGWNDQFRGTSDRRSKVKEAEVRFGDLAWRRHHYGPPWVE